MNPGLAFSLSYIAVGAAWLLWLAWDDARDVV